MHVAVRLGPQADATGDRLRQRILKIELAVEVALDLGPTDPHLEFMPLLRGGRRIAHPLDRASLALFELPQHEIVLETIGADRQIIAVGLEIEQDSGALVDPAGQSLEAYRDFATR